MAEINPIEFGEMRSDVGHLKNQMEIVHGRIDQVQTTVSNIESDGVVQHAEVISKLAAIVENHESGKSYRRGVWKTVCIIGGILAAIIGIFITLIKLV